MLLAFKTLEAIQEKLYALKNRKVIENFSIDLSIGQYATITIVSGKIDTLEKLIDVDESFNLYQDYSIMFIFVSLDDHDADFSVCSLDTEKSNLNFGLRRSLNSLIDNNTSEKSPIPIITFFSYKGGVGRTTSLALFAGYYANLGKKVFVIDCDFEAPGLLNFYKVSQFDNPKSGFIEFILDSKFYKKTKLTDSYLYEVPSIFTGEGKIHLMPAGNIFSENKYDYLEGLSRVDFQGKGVFLNDFKALVDNIKTEYNPDVILVDSRTGFNNVFGTLLEISDTVVALCGDDHQNVAGIEFLLEKFSASENKAKLCMVLSIVSSSLTRRFEKFNQKIQEKDVENLDVQTFVFPRESMLELIGTELEDLEDIKYFMTPNSSTSYSRFFEYLASSLEVRTNKSVTNKIESENTTKISEIDIAGNDVVQALKDNMPDPYADNIEYNDNFFNKDFYIRKCMLDLFKIEYPILLGGKGTGKTALYKALQNADFFQILINKAEKNKQNFEIIYAIGSSLSDDGKYFELSTFLTDYLGDDSKVRKFWTIYLWNAVYKTNQFGKSSLSFDIKNNHETALIFKQIIESDQDFLTIEKELALADRALKRTDSRLIVTFDQLDFIVSPADWSKGISPLIRFCISNNFERIYPKLFLRRDLYIKLSNLTNKDSLDKKILNLEWSSEEVFAFLFKIVFAYAKEPFKKFLNHTLPSSFVNDILSRLGKKNQYNQLPAEEYLLRPLTIAFFGEKTERHWGEDAYDVLYNNIKNADQTISLRPFLDIISLGIKEKLEFPQDKFSNLSVLPLEYCMLLKVRANAVGRHFNDLANETGNEIIKLFVDDIKNTKIDSTLKFSSLHQDDFETLVEQVKKNHPDELSRFDAIDFEDALRTNGIIFVTHISGGWKKYSFAFLYKYYLGLSSPPKGKIYGKNRKYSRFNH